MFRTALLRSVRAPMAPVARKQVISPATINQSFVRTYAGFPPLTKDIARERILELLEGYNKVKATEIKDESSYIGDLGLDSLDVVEVIMEVEHEFNIQIPDQEADSLKTVGQTVDYILSQSDAC